MFDLDFKLKTSRQLTGIFLLLLMASCLIVVTLTVSIIMKIGLLLSIFMYGLFILWRDVFLRATHSIVQIKQHEKQWWIKTNINSIDGATLHSYHVLFNRMVVLRFKIKDVFLLTSCVIFSDSLCEDQFRRLLIVLRAH